MNWYRLAAEQGLAQAQNNLGIMYARGQGVSRDYVGAYMWFNLSAVQGNQQAAVNQNRTASLMTPEQLAEAQKLVREWKPNTQSR